MCVFYAQMGKMSLRANALYGLINKDKVDKVEDAAVCQMQKRTALMVHLLTGACAMLATVATFSLPNSDGQYHWY
jgi:hypothetical protein